MTSNSISFQPETHLSTSICVIGDSLSPSPPIILSSWAFCAMPPPVPPSVNAGLTMTGYPICDAYESASSILLTTLDSITGSPIDMSMSLNFCLSSALSIVSGSAPRSFTPFASRNPSLASCIDKVSPICPPSVGSMLSGFSFLIILLNTGRFSGSM